ESEEPRAQPAVPVAAPQRAEEHPHRHRRQRSGRREDGAETHDFADRSDGKQRDYSQERRRPLQVAAHDAPRGARVTPFRLPHNSTTSRSSRMRGSPADRFRSTSERNSASTAVRTPAGASPGNFARTTHASCPSTFSGGAPASSVSAS